MDAGSLKNFILYGYAYWEFCIQRLEVYLNTGKILYLFSHMHYCIYLQNVLNLCIQLWYELEVTYRASQETSMKI